MEITLNYSRVLTQKENDIELTQAIYRRVWGVEPASFQVEQSLPRGLPKSEKEEDIHDEIVEISDQQ